MWQFKKSKLIKKYMNALKSKGLLKDAGCQVG